jgi:hypothetical protein
MLRSLRPLLIKLKTLLGQRALGRSVHCCCVIRWLTLKQRNLEEVQDMSNFDVAVFKVADVPAIPHAVEQPTPSEDRYVLVVSANLEVMNSSNGWDTSDTLFGLQKKAKDLNVVLDWEEVERQVTKLGFYKRTRPSRMQTRQDTSSIDRPK